MKNSLAMGFLLFLMGSVVFATPPKMQAGVTALYDHYNYTVSQSGLSVSDDRHNAVFGVFFDAIYLRFIAEYQTMLSGAISAPGYGSTDYPSGFSVSFVNLLALGKYPIQLGTTTLWPEPGGDDQGVLHDRRGVHHPRRRGDHVRGDLPPSREERRESPLGPRRAARCGRGPHRLHDEPRRCGVAVHGERVPVQGRRPRDEHGEAGTSAPASTNPPLIDTAAGGV